MLPPPKGTSVETIRNPSDADLFAIGPVSVAEAKQRLDEGDSCVVATDDSGLAAAMWCSERKRFIKWIGCNIRPPEGHVHFYNAWVRPDARGLNLVITSYSIHYTKLYECCRPTRYRGS